MDSKGEYASDPGKKINFGYNVKWNKSVTNLQGNLNLIFRRGTQVYQIKSTAMSQLSINAANPCSQQATFISKGNLTDVTIPTAPKSIYGGLSLQVTMTDNGEPGVADMIGFTLFNGSTLVFSSSWPATKTVELPLVGGNNVVHNGVICNASNKTTTLVTSSKNPSSINEKVTFTATVGGGTGSTTPEGSIIFKVNGTQIGSSVLLSGGLASFDYTPSLAESYIVTADYTSSNTYGNSTGTLTQMVNATTVNVTSSKNPSISGEMVSFTATVAGGTDGKTVQFKDGSASLGTSTVASGKAIFATTTPLAVTSHNITAVYDGTVISDVYVQVVNNVSVTLASSKNSSAVNESVTLTATVTNPEANSTITFKDGSTAIGSPATITGGVATITTSFTLAGTHNLTAVYNGTGSISPVLAQVVTSVNASVVLSSSKNPSLVNDQVTFIATVAQSGSIVPTGTVTFKSAGITIGTGPVTLVGGMATITSSYAAVGSYLITASYSGGSGYPASEASLTQVVKTYTITLTSSKNPQLPNQSVILTSTVTGISGSTPTGTVTFKKNGTAIGSAVTLNSSGQAAITTSFATTGSYSITAVYSVTGQTAALTQSILSKLPKVAEIVEIGVPTAIEPMLKAYPSPFTDRLNIEFSSATDTQAKLEIYSITGAKLTTLFDAPVNGGELYNVEYVPNLVSSQMVFYHLTMNGKTQVGKVIYNERR
jgi:hypothetical protein